MQKKAVELHLQSRSHFVIGAGLFCFVEFVTRSPFLAPCEDFSDSASQRQNRARAPSRSDAMVWCFIHFGVPVFRTEAGGVLCKTNVGGEAASDGRFTEGTVQLFRILYQKD